MTRQNRAVGVASARSSRPGFSRCLRGLRLAPDRVERILRRSATDEPCPRPRTYVYPAVPEAELPETSATCEGGARRNAFYGDGIVNALDAVRGSR